MSTPNICGFRTAVPWATASILDTDDGAFQLGACIPGYIIANYQAHWYNIGGSKLHDPTLTLIAHPTADVGAYADTLGAMQIGFSASYLLAAAIPADSINTAGFTSPGIIIDPMLPFETHTQLGVKWSPPGDAATGFIRKAFQWDGAYLADGWDVIYYPMSNYFRPDTNVAVVPNYWGVVLDNSPAVYVFADAAAPTGYGLLFSTPGMDTNAYYYHDSSKPWNDVSNATGYYIEMMLRMTATANYERAQAIRIKDGSYYFTLFIGTRNIHLYDGAGAHGFIASINYSEAYIRWGISVQGTTINIYKDGVLLATDTISGANTDKILSWGGAMVDPDHFSGLTYVGSFSYSLAGPTRPTG